MIAPQRALGGGRRGCVTTFSMGQTFLPGRKSGEKVTLASVQASGLEYLNGEMFGMKVIGGLHRNNVDLCRVNILP